MKKAIIGAVLLMIALLSGCSSSSPNYKIEMTKQLYFLKGHATAFEIKVTENKKAVSDLTITADVSMANMDHGTETVKLTDEKNGKYSGKVKLPMDGKYELTFNMNKDNKKTEKTIDYTVKKAAGVAMINGQWIKSEDLQFYQLVNKLQLEINRENVKKTYTGSQLEDELAYIDSQEKNAKDQNLLLTQIIRIRSMALLGEQRGHQATTDAIAGAIAKDHTQYDQYPAVKSIITSFGEKKFSSLEEKEYKYTILADQVMADVTVQAKKDNPNVNDQEVNFQAQQSYEDLLVSQMNSLKIQIL
jgi:outer membrane murein-binding lipoprotein Lpp